MHRIGRHFRLLAAVLLGAACLAVPTGAAAKEWRTLDGEVIRGQFFSRDETTTRFKDETGAIREVSNANLSEKDTKLIRQIQSYLDGAQAASWPERVEGEGIAEISGGPGGYRSEHFEILAEQPDRAFVAESVQVLEDTRDLIGRLPLPIRPTPPVPAEQFTVRMLDRETFEADFGEATKHLHPGRVRGAYLAKRRELWIPTDAVWNDDLKMTLVHEVTHQSMHDWLTFLPLWFIEGFAEYLAVIPYEDGAFRFDRSEVGLRRAIGSRYDSPALKLVHPGKLLTDEGWRHTSMHYLSSLMLVYHLAEFDRDGRGTALKLYLREIDAARKETRPWFDELQRMADDYDGRVRRYRSEMERYQLAVRAAKRKLRSGRRVFVREASGDRVVIADSPSVPTRPAAPQKPENLEEVKQGVRRSLETIGEARARGLASVLAGRSVEVFAEEMKAAFRSRGFEIEFR